MVKNLVGNENEVLQETQRNLLPLFYNTNFLTLYQFL